MSAVVGLLAFLFALWRWDRHQVQVSTRLSVAVEGVTTDMRELKGDVQLMVGELRDTLKGIADSLTDVRERTANLEGHRKGRAQ